MAYVPIACILAGMTAYTVLAGADFGAGLWTLLAPGIIPSRSSRAAALRDHARHAMGPVWEANHVWLVFVLVVCWTGYPVAFGSIVSTLSAPLLIAVIGIVFRGAAYALRSLKGSAWFAEGLLGTSSVLTPFALATAIGGIALGRVPVGNAAGNLVTSWLNPASILIGFLAVAFSGYLAAVYLAADAQRLHDHDHSATERPHPAVHRGGCPPSVGLASAFRHRALASGLAAGALAVAGLLVMRSAGLSLLHGSALVFVIISGVAGLATMALCWAWRFGLARLTAGLAVAAVVVGWAAGQAPRLLPGMTIPQAAAGHSVLVAMTVAICAGLAILVPSLILLYTLFLRGRLETPEDHGFEAPAPRPAARAGFRMKKRARARTAVRTRGWTSAAIVGLAGGTGLLIFANPVWTHLVGAALLILCAVSVFILAAEPPSEDSPSTGSPERPSAGRD
ncbi:MAG TPA: cytochrome d ubiquinol oxidase subunit II [Trebonia sp.]|jgi:cytochrome d ubiquinol oxidase subunit II